MKFSVKVWRRNYDFAHSIGKLLKDARCSSDGKKPKVTLNLDSIICLNTELDKSINYVRKYLDSCNMVMPEPLWKYNKDDPKTWVSSNAFAYEHMLK